MKFKNKKYKSLKKAVLFLVLIKLINSLNLNPFVFAYYKLFFGKAQDKNLGIALAQVITSWLPPTIS